MSIKTNIQNIKEKIDNTCLRIGKNPDDIKIVVASKYADESQLKDVYAGGLNYFGENRVQDLLAKQEKLSDLDINWDFIGHLQTNKVKKIIGHVNIIHSVDSLRLAEEISRSSKKIRINQSILIQVNSSLEETKSGFSPVESLQMAKKIAKLENINLVGLMSIAPNVVERDLLIDHFAISANIFNNIQEEIGENFEHLSMGMSNDFEIAIEYGANIIRLGSIIFK